MFVTQGDKISIIESAEFDNELKKGNYIVKQNPMTGEFYLTPIADFTFPDKVYGNPQAYVDRYFNTFNTRKGNLGILLGGIKGTGKSLLAKMLCSQSELPVIIVTESYGGIEFKQFLSQIKQECLVFMDEFEKVYHNNEEQQKLLSVLDGVFEGKKMFILTANTMSLSQFLTNRTGRIYYSREYTGLSADVINEVIDDILVNKGNKEVLVRDLMTIGEVNMDILVTIILEMNRYNETSTESLSFLNIFPEEGLYVVKGAYTQRTLIDKPTTTGKFGDVDWGDEDNFIEKYQVSEGTYAGNPLVELNRGNIYTELTHVNSIGRNEYTEVNWESQDLNVNIENSNIVIRNKHNKDYLIFSPILKKSKNKISSDLVIKNKKSRSKKEIRLIPVTAKEARGLKVEF